jgi:hypothetical protein
LQNSILRITRVKWTGAVAQVVEHLFYMLRALSPSLVQTTTKEILRVKHLSGDLEVLETDGVGGRIDRSGSTSYDQLLAIG